MSGPLLELHGVSVEEAGVPRCSGLSLALPPGALGAVWGASEPVLTALARALMGDPRCRMTGGSVRFRGEPVAGWRPRERAERGFAWVPGHPPALEGVSASRLARASWEAVTGVEASVREFRQRAAEGGRAVGLAEGTITAELSPGMGSEDRMRVELLHLWLSAPALVVWQGGASESLRRAVAAVRAKHPVMSWLVLTADPGRGREWDPAFTVALTGATGERR